MRVEKSYRGISERLARHYLAKLGGEVGDGDAAGAVDPGNRADDPADRADVVGDGWRASVSSETVEIGPSLTLTEVTVVFEGDEDALDGLVEDFSRKALRAGG